MAELPDAGRLGTNQSVAFTAVAGTITNAIATGCYMVRVVVTSAAFIKIGNTPTATTSDVYVPANWPEYFAITPGMKVSAVQSAAGGTLYVTEII